MTTVRDGNLFTSTDNRPLLGAKYKDIHSESTGAAESFQTIELKSVNKQSKVIIIIIS